MNNWENNKITPFKFYCQHVLPLVYDESLSYYEVLCKLQVKLNEVIKTQNELQDAFQNLLTWVDTQLETYAKEQMQEWLNDGTLERIIKEILLSNYYYNVVEDMINDTNLKVNDKCYCLGYYEIGDKGANDFIITEAQPTSYYVTLSNGLYAKRINYRKNNVLQYGLKSNVNENNRELIQQIIDESDDIYFNEGIYFIELLYPQSLSAHDNMKFYGNATVLKGIGSVTEEKGRYTMLFLGSKNVNVEGITFDGTKELVINVGEWGYGHTITGQNITIKNCVYQNCYGDGIIIDTTAQNVTVKNCTFDANRRQGISICGVDNCVIQNCEIKNTKGTPPESAIDIEPWRDNIVDNILIENINIHDNVQGIIVSPSLVVNNRLGVKINNISITNCEYGLVFDILKTNNCHMEVSNILLDNIKTTCIQFHDWGGGYEITELKNINIHNYPSTNCIVINSDTLTNYNLYFKNIMFDETDAKQQFVFIGSTISRGVHILGTNGKLFHNWALQDGLVIENAWAYNEQTDIDLNTTFYSEIIRAQSGRLTITPPTFGGAQVKGPVMKITFLNNCILALEMPKTSDVIGTGGCSIGATKTPKGTNVEIQALNGQMCMVGYYGDVTPWNL